MATKKRKPSITPEERERRMREHRIAYCTESLTAVILEGKLVAGKKLSVTADVALARKYAEKIDEVAPNPFHRRGRK